MSQKDKEVPSKEVAQDKEAQEEVEQALEEKAAEEELLKEWDPEAIRELIKRAAEGEEAKERFLRLQAEVENNKKRLAKDKEEFLKFANVRLLESLMPILDNFDLALQHAEKDHDPKHVLQGIQMIRKLFGDAFKKEGLETIEPLNEKFDPHKHEAIGFEETDDKEEGIVVDVLQVGYLLNDRLIRPAKVRITKKKEEEKNADK